MPAPRHLVVLGTGAFASALARALARRADPPTCVHIVSRGPDRARHLCDLANAHATLAGTATRFSAHVLDPAQRADLRPLLARIRPTALVVCASEQSPAEGSTAPSAWTALVQAAGFGITLPLQAAPAMTAASACAEASPGTAVVNACFPDAVNPLLRAAGLPVLCGLGNVATLSALLRCQLLLPDESPLKLLAHHAHLHAPPTSTEEACGWLDGRPLTALPRLLERIRSQPRAQLNEIGAAAGADILGAITHGHPHHGHVPGPHGRPGGYPVVISGSDLALRLPPGRTEAQAVAWNRERSALDGVTLGEDGKAAFTDRTLRILLRHWPEAPRSFGPQDVDGLRTQQVRLRARLRLSEALPTL
jgi:hypothetical protein